MQKVWEEVEKDELEMKSVDIDLHPVDREAANMSLGMQSMVLEMTEVGFEI